MMVQARASPSSISKWNWSNEQLTACSTTWMSAFSSRSETCLKHESQRVKLWRWVKIWLLVCSEKYPNLFRLMKPGMRFKSMSWIRFCLLLTFCSGPSTRDWKHLETQSRSKPLSATKLWLSGDCSLSINGNDLKWLSPKSLQLSDHCKRKGTRKLSRHYLRSLRLSCLDSAWRRIHKQTWTESCAQSPKKSPS